MEDTNSQEFRPRSDITPRIHSTPVTSRTPRARTPRTRTAGLYRASRLRDKTAGKAKYGFREKLLAQCIVCAVLLASLMLTNLVNTGFSSRIIGWIDTRVGEDTDISAFKSDDGSLLGFFDAVKTIFGYEAPAPENAPLDSESLPVIIDNKDIAPEIGSGINTEDADTENGIEIGTGVTTESGTDSSDIIRVDENMLDELNNAEDIYNK